MTTHVAFLRAINVAGHAVVKMKDLERAFVGAGCTNVCTYIQSGNVLFDAPGDRPAHLVRDIQGALSKQLGIEGTVILRTLAEVGELVASRPFEGIAPGEDAKLYVSFLAEEPRAVPDLPLRSPQEGLEAFLLRGREVFIVSRRVNARFGFPNHFVEKELGVPATTRNWNTVTKIVQRFSP